MKKQNKRNTSNLVPELRFPEFQDAGDWVERKLGDVANVISGQSPDGSKYNDNKVGIPFYQGKSDFGAIYLNKPTKWTTHVTKLADPGDILMSVRAPVGALNISTETVCIGRGLASLQAIGSKWYLFYYLKSIQDSIVGNGGSIFDSINKYQIEAIIIPTPSLPEQQKIADCLSSLDELIQLQTKKLEALQSHKKGLLQNLFPAEGETVPRSRFPEFEGKGDWVERKLGEVFVEVPRQIDMEDEQLYSLIIVKRRYEGIIPRGELLGKEIKVKTQFSIKEDDFLISKRQIVHNACAVVKKEFEGSIVSNEYSVLRTREEFSIDFIEYFVKQPAVSKSFMDCSVGIVIEKMLFKLNRWFREEFSFPSLSEQQRIADCLASVDALIQEQMDALEGLKSHKKGLLQGSFPVMGE